MPHITNLLPHLVVCIHNWLYAYTASAAGLLVYKSSALRETDDMYRPVMDMIMEYDFRVVLQEVIPDKGMMFGRGELTVYRPANGVYPDEQVYLPGFVKKLQSTIGG